MSGGRATVAAKSNKQLRAQCGDICAVDPLGNLLTDICYFELKSLKRLSLDDLVKGNTGQGSFLAIWKTTREQAVRYDKTPVLIMKQNYWPVLVCSTDNGIRYLCGNVTPLLTAPSCKLRCVLFEDMLVSAPPNRRRAR